MKLARRLDRRTTLRAKSRRAAIKDQFRRGLQTERLEDRRLLAGDLLSPFTASSYSPYYNYNVPTDVTADGAIAPNDALAVINTLNADGSRQLAAGSVSGESGSALFVDVNNDGWVSPIDALTVINQLNAEGEPPDGLDDKVEYVFTTVDPATGQEITSVGAGKTFFLVMSARDLRPEGTYEDIVTNNNGTPTDPSDDFDEQVTRDRVRGVYAAYADILMDRSEVTAAVNEVQQVAFPNASSGTFKLTVNGIDTANISFNVTGTGPTQANNRAATAAAISAALNAANVLGPGSVEVTNSSGNNFRVRFTDINVDVPIMTTKDITFTAGSGNINVTEVVKGDPNNSNAILNAVTFSQFYLNGQSALNGTNPDRIDELGAFFSGNTAVGTGTGVVEVLRILMQANELPDGTPTEQTVLTPSFTNMVRPSDDTLVFANLRLTDPQKPPCCGQPVEPREGSSVLVSEIAFNTVTLTITAGPITANPDTDTVLEDSTAGVTKNVIANDVLNEGATGTIELRAVGAVTPAGAGTATRVGNSIQFIPAANFAGTATISYTAGLVGNSNPDDTATSVLTVTVTAVNDAPVIDAIATQTINEDASPAPTVNLTGIGAGGGADEAAQVLSVTATSSNPSLVAPTVNYTTGSSGTLTLTPAADASGTATITVTVTDDGGTASGGVNTTVRTFTVNVTAQNDAPVNLMGGAPITGATEQITTPGVALDFNASGGNQLSIADVDAASGSLTTTLSLGANQGTLTVGSQTATSITLNGTLAAINTQLASVRYTPAEGFTGSATLTIVTNDNGNTPAPAQTTTSTITIKLDPGVRPFAVDDRRTINEGDTAVLTIDALANDFKVATATTTITGVTQPPSGQGSAAVVGGQIQYTPPGGEFSGVVTFTYTIDDDDATSTGSVEDRTGNVIITITNVNDAPVAVNNNYGTAIGVPLTVPARGVLANDTDVDNDPATLVAVNASTPTQGSVILNQDGSFTYTPPAGVGGDFTFTYQARDPGGLLSNTATVSIHVAAPPQVTNSTASGQEDTALPISIEANYSDPTEGRPLGSVEIVTNVPSAAGSVAVAPDNKSFIYTPAANFNTTRPPVSPVSFTYRAKASDGTPSNVATVAITVNETNDNPTAVDDEAIAVRRSGSPPNEIGVDQDIVPNVLLNDTFAPDVNETLKVTGVNGATADASGNTAAVPTTGGGSVKLVNFQIKYTAPGSPGSDSITYTVSDFDAASGAARTGSDTGTVSIDVVDFVPKTISGTVYVDSDNDGVVDSGEKRLSSVDLRLTGTDFTNAAVDILVSTDINGNYTIPGANFVLKPPRPGSVYTLTQVQPAYLLSGLDTNTSANAQVTNTSRSDNAFTMSWAITDTSGNITGLNFGERGMDVAALSDSSGFMQEYLASSGRNGFIMALSLSGETYWSWTLEGDVGAWAGTTSVSATLSSDLSILTLRINGTQTVNLTQNYSMSDSTARFRILGIGSDGQYIIRVDGSANGGTDGMHLAANGSAGGEGEGEGSAAAYAGSADAVFAQQAWA